MASRLLSDSLLTERNQRSVSRHRAASWASAQRFMGLCLAIVLLLFVYVAEVSQGTTTAFDIEQLQMEHRQWQEKNQELAREIAEMESSAHVLTYAAAHGMVPRSDVTYLILKAPADPQ